MQVLNDDFDLKFLEEYLNNAARQQATKPKVKKYGWTTSVLMLMNS